MAFSVLITLDGISFIYYGTASKTICFCESLKNFLKFSTLNIRSKAELKKNGQDIIFMFKKWKSPLVLKIAIVVEIFY